MPRHRTTLLHFLLLALVLKSAHAYALGDNTEALKERLHQTDAGSSLDLPAMRPWHLKLTFDLLDEKGQTVQTGVIEEKWADRTRHTITYTSGSSTWTEVKNDQGLYLSDGADEPPELVDLLLSQAVHPMPANENIDSATPVMEKKQFGKVTLDCIMLSQSIKGLAYTPFGLFPTYCMDHDQPSLRLSSDFGTQLITRNTMGAFLGQHVAMEQSISRMVIS
jgi:hypothetical protein